VRRCEEPPSGPTSRHCCLCPPKSRRLGVRGQRITGLPTSGDRRNVRPTALSPDQRWHSLLLFVLVVGDPHEPTMLRSLAGLRRQCLRRGWLYGHWPFPHHPVLGGRRRSVLLFFTAGVLGHLAASSTVGSTPAGWSIPGASDTYTEHRSMSPICNETNVNSSNQETTVFT